MAHDLRHPMNESDQLLCVRLGDQEFALGIRAIREIWGVDLIHPPHAPSYVKGMINLHDNLAERLGVPRMLEQKSLIHAVNLYQSHRDDLHDQFKMMGRFRIT